MDKKKYPTKLAEMMEIRGFTDRKLANRIGFAVPSITNLRNGKRKGRLESMVLISEALNCKVEEIQARKKAKR